LTGQVKKTEPYCFATGGFSEIYRGLWTDPVTNKVTRVAIKLLTGVHTDPIVLGRVKSRLVRETKVWWCLDHENIVPFLGVCHNLGPSPAMISRLYDNGDVHSYLVKTPAVDRLVIIKGIANGLKYLHSKKVVHGDLKGHNVLIADDGTPQLADFGRSKLIEHRGFTTATFAGSARQMAPELLPSENDGDIPGPLTKEADVYAFSMVALEILTGKLPFHSVAAEMTVLFRVLSGKRPNRSAYPPDTFTDDIWALLVNCWAQEPAQRPGIATVVQRLQNM